MVSIGGKGQYLLTYRYLYELACLGHTRQASWMALTHTCNLLSQNNDASVTGHVYPICTCQVHTKLKTISTHNKTTTETYD